MPLTVAVTGAPIPPELVVAPSTVDVLQVIVPRLVANSAFVLATSAASMLVPDLYSVPVQGLALTEQRVEAEADPAPASARATSALRMTGTIGRAVRIVLSRF